MRRSSTLPTSCASNSRKASRLRGQALVGSIRSRIAIGLALPVLGIFQRTNAATAIAVLEQLGEELRPSRDEIARGFAELAIPGRMELFRGTRRSSSTSRTTPRRPNRWSRRCARRFANRRIHYVVAIGETKDAAADRRDSLGIALDFYVHVVCGFRASRDPAGTARNARGIAAARWGRAIADPIEALTVARRRADVDDVVVVTGSTFVVAGLREWYVTDDGLIGRGSLRLRGARLHGARAPTSWASST